MYGVLYGGVPLQRPRLTGADTGTWWTWARGWGEGVTSSQLSILNPQLSLISRLVSGLARGGGRWAVGRSGRYCGELSETGKVNDAGHEWMNK